MAQAISQSHSTEGSELGSYLAELLGFNAVVPRTMRTQSQEEKLLKKYQSILKKRASSSYDWQEFAEYLKVRKGEGNRIIVYVDGPAQIISRAELLEYGTPEKVADPLMRVAEAEFNNDFEFKRMHKL